ncbi:unnamed protein product [Lymnaea stagnalis]|uniref:Uncharacterized protein n=1 Tax=Lymnaea stagnalis TaxID=6523 RepID=A0AAV2HG06_LYMST
MAKARLLAADVYAEKAAEPLKPVKAAKMQCYKKVMPQLTVIQSEVAQCIMELVKSQKIYITEGGVAHDARTKALDAEDKLKRKSTGIFQSLSGLQKTCAKLRSRTETSEVKETSARNEYLLALAAANAHQIRYYSTDVPEIMKTLDCDIYEKIQESLTVAGQTAADIAQTEATSFKTVAAEASKICRAFSLQCYLFQNPVFTNLVQYQFDPCNGDTCNKVTSEHGAGPDLEKEARKWSTKVAKETRAIRDYYRQITVLQNAKSGDKTSETGSQESTTTADPEVRLEELKVNLRKAETARLKAEARLEALRLGGVNVDEWINQAQMESLAAEESGLARTPSQASLRTESSGGQSGTDDQEQTYTHYDDDDDFIDETFNTTSGSRSGRVYPIFCKALYDFVASNYDEMTIKAEEDLELVADGDGEGWVKAKNSLGQEGYIPETYVDLGGLSTAPAPLGVEAMNAINATVSDMGTQDQQPPPPATTTPDLQSPDLQQDTTSSYSSGDLEVQQTTEVMASDEHPIPVTVVTNCEVSWARALYDYEAQTEEELSFLEGALIRVMRKDDNGVDDGFWEGECNGRKGVFPSLVVEEIAGPALINDPLSPPVMPAPPDFSIPPPVQITLPTPDAEPPPPPVLTNGDDSHSIPCPSTADQSSKKVEFFGRSQSDKQGSHQDSSKQQQRQHHGGTPQHGDTLQHRDTPQHGDTQHQDTQKQKGPSRQQHQVSQQGHQQGQDVHQTAQDVPHTAAPEREVKRENKTLSKKPRHKYQQFKDSDDDVQHVRPVHPVQPLKELRAEPSPILRHKSLPSDLDIEKEEKLVEINARSDEDLWQDQQLHQTRPPQSPRSVRRVQQGISHSQPQLLSSPPPSRRLILQQRQHQQQQLQHYPSEPSTVNVGSPQHNGPYHLALDMSNNGSLSDQHRSRSYPSTPLASPQTEMDSLQNSLPHYSSPQKQEFNSQQRQELLKLYALSPTIKQASHNQQENFYLPPPPQPLTPGQKLDRKAELPSHPTHHRPALHQTHRVPTHQPQKVVHFLSDVPPRYTVSAPKQRQVNRPSLPAQNPSHWPSHPTHVIPILKQEGSLQPRPANQVSNNNRLIAAHDKRPLCFDDTDDDWESEEGEESLV